MGEAINKRIKEHKLATAAIKDRRWYQLEGMEYKNDQNDAKRKRQIASQAKRLEQEKLALAERQNLTKSNSTKSESECSTTNLGSCTDDELYDIAINEKNSDKVRKDARALMI